MDFEVSADEYTATIAKKLIELEVSDHEDNYNLSSDLENTEYKASGIEDVKKNENLNINNRFVTCIENISGDRSTKRNSLISNSSPLLFSNELCDTSKVLNCNSRSRKSSIQSQNLKKSHISSSPTHFSHGKHDIEMKNNYELRKNIHVDCKKQEPSVSHTLNSLKGSKFIGKYILKDQKSPSSYTASIISQSSTSSLSSRLKFWKNSNHYDIYDRNIFSKNSLISDLRKSFMIITSDKGSNEIKNILSHGSSKIKDSRSFSTSLKSMWSSNSNTDNSIPYISHPIPDQSSRDKIRSKLKNSGSLLSIDHTFGNDSMPTEINIYNHLLLTKFLDFCDKKTIHDYSTLPKTKQISDHIFKCIETDTIYKIIPLKTDDNIYTRDMILQELQIHRLVNGTTGFTYLLDSQIVNDASNDQNDLFYLVLHFKNHGIPLSQFKKLNSKMAKDILVQCTRLLYVAETKFNFEHRFMCLDHILIDSVGNVTICDYKLSRASQDSVILFTRLDHPLFFSKDKDYNYVIQSIIRSKNPKTCHIFDTKSNLYWLHYLVKNLITLCDDSENKKELEEIYSLLDPKKRKIFWKREGNDLESCGDLLALM